ncbi:MAG: efflux RND transporter periplasmic adaptor subunit [Bryobacteraceae bacterium]|nr:efflux RND transporter periplasmic adaptor subunit [Bryobacteraceae bacterium]MDW8376661.1 efflux RND transporter periplasmic adaptor subunit [Bryobacterales bacterium]
MKRAASLLLVLVVSACQRTSEPMASEPKRSPSSPPAAAAPPAPTSSACIAIPPDSPKLKQIQLTEVKLAQMPTEEFTVPGKVEVNPNRVSKVLLPVAGRVAEVLVRFGDAVRKNDPLVTVESPEADAAASAAMQAEAQVNEAKTALNKAQQDFDRVSELFRGDAVAKKEVIAAETALVQAKIALQQAQTAYQQAVARLELFGLSPGRFRQRIVVRAPLSGKITEMNVAAGEFRNDLSAPLMTIADLSSVWISAEVPETFIRLVKPGEIFDVTLSAYPGEVFRSRVARMADTLDPQTRTLKVWAELGNPQGKLRPEMFGEVRHIESYHQVPVVPARAVIQAQGRLLVYRESAPGCFEPVKVEAGRRSGDLIPVTAGLKVGERVIVDGAMLLTGN